MKTFTKIALLSTAAIIIYSTIKVDITISPDPKTANANETTPVESISHPQLTNNPVESIDYPRLIKMSNLLKGSKPSDYQEYKFLCSLATSIPKIGMTFDQARNTSWCFPYSRNITTNINGEFVQEVYLKRNFNGESDSRYSPRTYLYFTNGILTSIQE